MNAKVIYICLLHVYSIYMHISMQSYTSEDQGYNSENVQKYNLIQKIAIYRT